MSEFTRDELSLRDVQVNSIIKMLFLNKINLNELNQNNKKNLINNLNLENSFNLNELEWKILILDKKTTDIISSVLRVNDLLKCGITVHYLINQARSNLADVPAIYFIEPTLQNLELILKDLLNDYYTDYYINFTSSLPRDLLETFAKKIVQNGKSSKIKQIYDQYLDFTVTEPELFQLNHEKVYSILNNPKTNEDEITKLCDSISDGLFNVIIQSNTIPIIRAPVGGPAEIVAEKLGSKLKDYVINSKRLNTSSSISTISTTNNEDSLERSVLIILDRNIDFASMFAHSWIYQCMVFDVFNLQKNVITIPTITKSKNANETEKITYKKFDLDPNDFFWNENSHLPFPEAAENVEIALTEYKNDASEITKKTGVTNLNDLDPNSVDDTFQIQEVVKILPKLTQRKNFIDTHMNIFASLLKELEEKKLDAFFEIEQDVNSKNLKTTFMEVLNDGNTNNFDDKMRSFLYLFLTSTNGLSKDFIQDVESYFQKNNYDISALKYVYKLREFMQLSNMTLQNKSLENGNSTTDNATSTISSTAFSNLYNLTEGKLHGGVGSFISGIKKLLPEKRTIPITNVVEAIMDPLNSSQKNLETTDRYLYLDPKVTRGANSKKPKRQSYNKSTVFVVGGGNYLEYQNLQEWAHSEIHNPKKVIYGSTLITSPNEFLKEISSLGSNN